MGKKLLSPGKLFGAAILGAVLYALYNPKNGKKMREELRGLLKEIVNKSKSIGGMSKETYEEAVEKATRVYKKSRALTDKQIRDLRGLAEELKTQWRGKKKR